ncbi:MAG: MFS transporter [Spirochaetales bacterium]|nr:MFS transporter [Spirochaetales bacterium]
MDDNGSEKKSQKQFLISVINVSLIMVIALALNGILGVADFERSFRKSLINKFFIHANNLKTDIEASLNFGKPIYLFGNAMNKMFEESQKVEPDIKHLYVASIESEILYSTRDKVIGQVIPFRYNTNYELSRDKQEVIIFVNSYFLSIPLYANSREWVGNIFLEFDKDIIAHKIKSAIIDIVKYSLIILAGTIVLIILAQLLLSRIQKKETGSSPGNKKRELIIVFLILVLSQGIYSFYNYRFFKQTYLNVYNENISTLSLSISKDINKVLAYGLPIDRLKGAEFFLEKRLKGNPECSNLFITDLNGKILYKAGKDGIASIMEPLGTGTPFQEEIINFKEEEKKEYKVFYIKSLQSKNKTSGDLVLQINEQLINEKIFDILMDSGTIIIVSLIVAFMLLELMYLITGGGFIKRRKELITLSDSDNFKIIRLTSFIFLFSAFVPLSFLPLHIKHIIDLNPVNFLNFTENTMISIPISSYMVGILFSMLLVVFVLQKTLIRQVYFIMISLYALGTFLTIISDNIVTLTIARFIAGCGFGGGLLNNASLVISFTSGENRSTGFGINASGFAAASICSIPIGGIIVNQLGFIAGYWVAFAFAIMALIFTFCFIIKKEEHSETRKKTSLKDFFSLLKNRNIMLYILFMNIPFQLIFVGLFQFFFPLYMKDTLDLSYANIGRILCIFSVISLFASLISRLSDKIKNDKLLLGSGAIIAGVSLVLFNVLPSWGFILFLIVMVAMGIDNTFVDSIEEVFISKEKNSKIIGEDSLLKIYKTYEKIISIFVPLLLVGLITLAEFSISMLIIGIYSLIGGLVFIIFAQNSRQP